MKLSYFFNNGLCNRIGIRVSILSGYSLLRIETLAA